MGYNYNYKDKTNVFENFLSLKLKYLSIYLNHMQSIILNT